MINKVLIKTRHQHDYTVQCGFHILLLDRQLLPQCSSVYSTENAGWSHYTTLPSFHWLPFISMQMRESGNTSSCKEVSQFLTFQNTIWWTLDLQIQLPIEHRCITTWPCSWITRIRLKLQRCRKLEDLACFHILDLLLFVMRLTYIFKNTLKSITSYHNHFSVQKICKLKVQCDCGRRITKVKMATKVQDVQRLTVIHKYKKTVIECCRFFVI